MDERWVERGRVRVEKNSKGTPIALEIDSRRKVLLKFLQ